MPGRIAALYRHPVKGFTPEALEAATLEPGGYFPDDRIYAVENGPSGFDPDAPAHISKFRFTVLAPIPSLARIRTRYDGGMLRADTAGRAGLSADLRTETGRTAFAGWLEGVLTPDEREGPLKVVHADGHRFTDSRRGFVSILNLASVAALGEKMRAAIDPLRFRANVHVADLPAWVEAGWAAGTRIALGAATVELIAPIVRCIATHVHPETGERDLDVLTALRQYEGHIDCGLYVRVVEGGRLVVGDSVEANS